MSAEGAWAREYRQGRAEQVEQQRIANLIALAGLPELSMDIRVDAANRAADALLGTSAECICYGPGIDPRCQAHGAVR